MRGSLGVDTDLGVRVSRRKVAGPAGMVEMDMCDHDRGKIIYPR